VESIPRSKASLLFPDPQIQLKFTRLSVIKYALKEAKSIGYLKNKDNSNWS